MLSVIWRMLAACLPAIGSLQAQGTVCAGLLAMIVISACTSDGVLSMRRPSVDVGAQTAAIVQPLADPQTIAPAEFLSTARHGSRKPDNGGHGARWRHAAIGTLG